MFSQPVRSRAAYRTHADPGFRCNQSGFRVVLVVSPTGGVETESGAKDKASPTAPFTDVDVQRIAALPAHEQVEEIGKELVRRNPGFDGVVEPTFEKNVVIGLKFSTLHVTDISPVRALTRLQTLTVGNWPRPKGALADMSPLKGMALLNLDCSSTKVSDLSPLKGMKLQRLEAANIEASDLTPLQGMPLKHLGLAEARRVTNLQPLQGMPLMYLNLSHLPVSDLSLLADMTSLRDLILQEMPVSDLNPLQGLNLRWLALVDSQVSDLSPLRGMALETVSLTPRKITKGLDVLRDIKSIKTIGVTYSKTGFPAADFWERYDKGEFGRAFTDADVQRIAALPAAEQVEEVRTELMRRNPGFDGHVEHKIESGVVTEFKIVTDQVTDIAPIRVFNSLRVLECCGTPGGDKPNGLLADLTPLKGMNLAGLTQLRLNWTKVDDMGLVHFKDCKNLTLLGLADTQVSDTGLAYFKSCKSLRSLELFWISASDVGLAHFKDCKDLTGLALAGTRVSDVGLALFKDRKSLRFLNLDHTQVGDAGLAHFKDMPLTRLWIDNTGITDLTPLQSMPLEDIHLTPKNIVKGLDILRDMKSLKTIGIAWDQSWPAAEFWERYDKGEFK
jgi:Leucine-rich repeat (LRR) protein